MIPSVVGVVVITLGILSIYLGVHGAPFLNVYPVGQAAPWELRSPDPTRDPNDPGGKITP